MCIRDRGAIQRWDSKNDNIGEDVGQGEQEIKNMTEDRIDLELRFKRPFELSLIHI